MARKIKKDKDLLEGEQVRIALGSIRVTVSVMPGIEWPQDMDIFWPDIQKRFKKSMRREQSHNLRAIELRRVKLINPPKVLKLIKKPRAPRYRKPEYVSAFP